MPNYKRKRGESAADGAGAGAGARASRRVSGYTIERRANPASAYMRQYIPRTPQTLSAFGKNRSSASAEQLALRDNLRVYGRGRYSVGKNWRKFSQSVGLAGAGRRLVEGGTGMALSLMGQGGYVSNSLIDTDMEAVPQVASAADETGAITVSRREYVKDITVLSQAFAVEDFPLNPGMEETFPWLSQIAANYEEYDLHQCVFTYRSTVTDIGSSTSGQAGTLIMATNYNAAAGVFADKVAMMEYDGAMSSKTTDNMMHGVECDDSKRSGPAAHYVRSGPVGAGQDVKSYDHGIFQVAHTNVPYAVGSQMGELWVSYTVTLRKPKFAVGRGALIGTDLFVSGGAEGIYSVLGNTLRGQANNIGCTLQLLIGGDYVLTFPPDVSGSYEVLIQLEGLSTTQAIFGAPILGGNVTARIDMYAAALGGAGSGDSPTWYSGTNEQTSGGIHVYRCRVNVSPVTGSTPNTITFDQVHAASVAPTQSTLTVSELNPFMSYKALGVGPVGLRTDAPVLVNSTGAIVAV